MDCDTIKEQGKNWDSSFAYTIGDEALMPSGDVYVSTSHYNLNNKETDTRQWTKKETPDA